MCVGPDHPPAPRLRPIFLFYSSAAPSERPQPRPVQRGWTDRLAPGEPNAFPPSGPEVRGFSLSPQQSPPPTPEPSRSPRGSCLAGGAAVFLWAKASGAPARWLTAGAGMADLEIRRAPDGGGCLLCCRQGRGSGVGARECGARGPFTTALLGSGHPGLCCAHKSRTACGLQIGAGKSLLEAGSPFWPRTCKSPTYNNSLSDRSKLQRHWRKRPRHPPLCPSDKQSPWGREVHLATLMAAVIHLTAVAKRGCKTGQNPHHKCLTQRHKWWAELS